MMRVRKMTLIPTLEPYTAPASDLQSPKKSHRHTVMLTAAKELMTGLPESETSTWTVYSPASSFTRGQSLAWVSRAGREKVCEWEKDQVEKKNPKQTTVCLTYRWSGWWSSWLTDHHKFQIWTVRSVEGSLHRPQSQSAPRPHTQSQ